MIKNSMRSFLIGSFMTAAMLFLPGQSGALTIKQYDAMTKDDRADYDIMLMDGALSYLDKQGRDSDIGIINKLFLRKYMKEKDRNDPNKFPAGMIIYRSLTKQLRAVGENNPHLKPPEIEDVLSIILDKIGIKIPDAEYKQFGKDFKPSDKQFADEEK